MVLCHCINISIGLDVEVNFNRVYLSVEVSFKYFHLNVLVFIHQLCLTGFKIQHLLEDGNSLPNVYVV